MSSSPSEMGAVSESYSEMRTDGGALTHQQRWSDGGERRQKPGALGSGEDTVLPEYEEGFDKTPHMAILWMFIAVLLGTFVRYILHVSFKSVTVANQLILREQTVILLTLGRGLTRHITWPFAKCSSLLCC